ncbi:PH domain-containing protein [Streptacidiphilus sp. 4-A2]|nr:PH domain-containing protein [Streptacidiphilus sp. 4-A2]
MSVESSRTVIGPPALPRVWQPVLTRLVFLGFALLSLVFFSGMAALGPGDWQLHDRIGIGVCGLLCASVLVLLARPVARADRHGVTVVNFVRSRRVEWPEILGVNLRQGDPWVLLDLADGGTLAVVAIQPGSGRRQAIRAARELRACVDAYGTARH